MENDPEIVNIWLRSRLNEDPEIVSIINKRAFDDVFNTRGQALPFVYWSGNNIETGNNYGRSNRFEWQYDVRGVWDSLQTGASRSPGRQLSRALKRVLCDTDPYRAEVPGIGWVWECKFLRWYRPPANDQGDRSSIESGITIYLLTS